GPRYLPPAVFRRFQAIGQQLSRELQLIGLFGVDAVLTNSDVFAIEINPRYSASIEVLERASAQRTSVRRSHRLLSIDWHEAACCFRTLPAPVGQSDECCGGKKIIFAKRDGNFEAAAARWVLEQNLTVSQPAVADIPAVGTTIQAGQPILTLLADGSDAGSVRNELHRLQSSLATVLPIV
ncbi:MAG: ATP-grasp domain-containing protein, partial [Planctomycetota bacterium]|nr:ATP-grasp domain-containing protein [Planctomycetota bacterium]